MKLKLNLALAVLLLCTFALQASDHAEKSAAVDALLQSFIPDGGPGAAMMVIQDGKRVYNKSFGYANMAKHARIGDETNFELASVSKEFTAMAIMILAEEGKLSYSDPLSKFLPEFGAVGQKIKLEHLLHHTSGLRDYFNVWDRTGHGAITSERVMETLAKQKTLLFKPGSQFDYSNSGYMVLAQVVERASGMKFPKFMQEKIFKPLGMDDTLIYDETHPAIDHFAECYDHDLNLIQHDEWDNVYGDGSVHSTLEDLYRWDQALYTEKLVKAGALAQAFTSGRLNNGKETGYGFGWGIDRYQGAKVVSHGGEWLGYDTFIYRIPEWHFTAIFLSNGSWPGNCDKVMADIARIYYPLTDSSVDQPNAAARAAQEDVTFVSPIGLSCAPAAGAEVQLSAAAVSADGLPLSYAWTFGDGASASGASVSHTFSAPGTHQVKVTATAGTASAGSELEVTVGEPPLNAPPPDDF